MKRFALLVAVLAVLATASASQAGWAVGVNFGPGFGYCHRPHYYGYYGYYRPYPVYVGPPPVVAVPVAVPVAPAAPAVSLSPPQPHSEETPPPPPAEQKAPTLPAPTPV